jgi:hypothetical protein
MSAVDVCDKIDELWQMADHEPVIIEHDGKAKYLVAPIEQFVVIPREEYERLRAGKELPKAGFARDLLAGVDTEALLNVDISDVFKDYM